MDFYISFTKSPFYFLATLLGLMLLLFCLSSRADYYHLQSSYFMKCPEEVDIEPCKCNNSSEAIDCYGMMVNDCTIREVFARLMPFYESFQEKIIKSLKLYKTDVTHLSQDILGDLAVESLDVNGNQNLSLTKIDRATLIKSKDTLKHFKYSGLSQASWVIKHPNDGSIFEIVDGFTQLNSFWISDASIPKVQRSAFGRCELSSLSSLKLQRCEIEEIGDYAFYRLPNLTILDLRDNLINKLTNNTFAFEKASEDILYIDLRGNLLQVAHIEKGAFTKLNRPVRLNLDYNLIEYLDEDVFAPLLYNPRSSIIVSKNPIKCDCRMQWLKKNDYNYIDRIHGLICDQATEIWYFTPADLENECNKTFKTEKLAISVGNCLIPILFHVKLIAYFILALFQM